MTIFSAQRPLRLFVIAGEPSGDLLGGMVLQALRQELPEGAIILGGIGGEAMMAAGLDSLFPMQDITAFGLTEILPRIPAILRRVHETAAAIDQFNPDIILTIDAPDFCFRAIKKRKTFRAPVIHMVAPTVWAWRPGRARKIARIVDHLLCLFPFEPPYFEKEGLAATAIGHPITASKADQGDGHRFRLQHGIAPDTPVLTVLLGSRTSEINRLQAVFGDSVRRLCAQNPDLRIIVPTIPTLSSAVKAIIADWPGKPVLVIDQSEKYDAFAASKAALAASGTVSLELAMANLPHIIAYRVTPVSAWLFRRLSRTKFVNLINISTGRLVVPECLQENCHPDKLVAALAPLLNDPDAITAQQDAFNQVMIAMGRGGGISPAQRAAQQITGLVSHSSP